MKFWLILFVAIVFAGCKKDLLTDDSMVGLWQCDSYEYYFWRDEDTTATSYNKTFNEPCFMNLQSGTTDDYFFGIGTARLPLNLPAEPDGTFNESQPVVIEGPFAAQKVDTLNTTYNLGDQALTILQYGLDRQLRVNGSFKMVDDKHLNMTIYLRDTDGATNRFTRAVLSFTR